MTPTSVAVAQSVHVQIIFDVKNAFFRKWLLFW